MDKTLEGRSLRLRNIMTELIHSEFKRLDKEKFKKRMAFLSLNYFLNLYQKIKPANEIKHVLNM